ncbi:uncharacterized protein LOC109604897 isoform X2 [Aethina tumida]|uniref:uncharacterized protein LOC109604897 isoform X2 n=1 Tax=Aethina tumida TaxID=116153 RepID=UPI00214866C1|nr:uncharacterized protein LOC109604897 isoform X2 [Aethina tumida]
MYGDKPPPNEPQQWSVHAEFTISHPGATDPDNVPRTHTERNEDGVRMTYTWTPPPAPPPWTSPPPSASASKSSIESGDRPVRYGYQKGNLFFTSTPPSKRYREGLLTERIAGTGIQDSSGYGSDLLSPNSLASGSLPRPILPYNRKCRSTCNITLTTNQTNQPASNPSSVCGRTQSLRCQTPTAKCDHQENYYGYGDELSCPGRCSPVMEACESCISGSTQKLPTRASTFSTPVQRELSKRDACVQTTEMIDKCTSPFLKMGYEGGKRKYTRHRTEPIHSRRHSPGVYTPDSLDSSQHISGLSKSKSLRKLTATQPENLSDHSKASDSSKKPRTVHIDVYCTGTELESGDSLSESENDTASTPQTVFESGKVCVTHKKANEDDLPFRLQKQSSRDINKLVEESKQVSDDESVSYPSKISSYSTIRDFSSSISSVPKSWTDYSSSRMTVPDDCDSIANTSWKDTFSDVDSLLQSRSSIAQTDSYDLLNRRLYNSNSIDETPEFEGKKFLDTPSATSLQYSDSFEYANSEDKLRIKKMEDLWKNKAQHNKQWKSPQTERKNLLAQQKKMQDYIANKLKTAKKWDSRDSDSDGSDDSVKGWTFVKGQDVEKSGSFRLNPQEPTKPAIPAQYFAPVCPLAPEVPKLQHTQEPEPHKLQQLAPPQLDPEPPQTETKVCDNPPSPNTKHLMQRMSLDPTLRTPFALFPGFYTEQRYIANRFGTVVNVLRKPGHHIGPAKNPDCTCEHCTRHFESLGRFRTRSVGDSPTFQAPNWKAQFKRDVKSTDRTVESPAVMYTDF